MAYIDRDAFKEKYLCCGYLPEMSEAEFDAFPAADVVPVVRCKNCKHWDKFVGEARLGFCFAWKVDSYDEDFCSYSEH